MKFFEVEYRYSDDIIMAAGMTKTFDKILDTLKLINPKITAPKFPEEFYRFTGDRICNAVSSQVYWTNDITTNHSNYNISPAREFFKTKNDEFWISGSDLTDILIGKSLPQKIMSPLSEEHGYNFATNLLFFYDASTFEHGPVMPKGVPESIFLLDLLIPLAADSPNYLKGIQTKWAEERKNKPELFILTGERTAK